MKIKPEDFRIGNLVLDEDNEIQVVRSINKYAVSHDNNIFSQFPHMYPIQLSGQWLDKFGFKYTEQNWYYLEFGQHHLTICLDGSFKAVIGSRKCVREAWNIDIGACKYVHQLQNLYFFLTKKELKHED